MLYLVYLKALWNCFQGSGPKNPELDEQYHQLLTTAENGATKDISKLEKIQKAYVERVSLDSFITDFRVAECIAAELRDK